MTELRKDVARIIEVVKNEGVKERVVQRKKSYKFDAKFDRDLKAKVESICERKLMTLFFDLRSNV
jgi:hypothetical protein